MILGTGVDIVEVLRMKGAVKKWGDALVGRIFTEKEIRYCKSRKFPYQHLAARFAAKEAVVKAIGEGRRYPVKWTDIEVLNDGEGRPSIEFHDGALRLKKKKGIMQVIVSMSHSKDYAIANAILLKRSK